jgi:hypothetical protein
MVNSVVPGRGLFSIQALGRDGRLVDGLIEVPSERRAALRRVAGNRDYLSIARKILFFS